MRIKLLMALQAVKGLTIGKGSIITGPEHWLKELVSHQKAHVVPETTPLMELNDEGRPVKRAPQAAPAAKLPLVPNAKKADDGKMADEKKIDATDMPDVPPIILSSNTAPPTDR